MKTPAFFTIVSTFILFTLYQPANAQIQIVSGNQTNPEQLVQKIVGPGIMYDNVSYQGAGVARGYFYDGDTTELGIETGIFLTSGAGYIIPGPNSSSSAGVNNGTPGDATLNSITTSTTHDASVLKFDFVPESDTVTFRYVFGSEEYNEYVNSSFNDVFGFFVTGHNPQGGNYSNKNIAIIPGTDNIPVSINNVNNGNAPSGIIPTGPCNNCQYFKDNTNGLYIEFDGLTVVLTAWLLAVPFETYSIKLGVADCGDGIYDSGIFIEENSFKVTQPVISFQAFLDPPGLTANMVEGNVNADVVFRLANPVNSAQTLYFEIGGTATNGEDYAEIADSIVFGQGQDSAVLSIAPLSDQSVEGDETVKIILGNIFGWFTRHDTLELIIEDYNALTDTISPPTIICEGYEAELWVNVNNGYPPYSYSWEPGGFASDSIFVSPDTTTTYVVTFTDLFGNSNQDSTLLTVIPACELEDLYFETTYNPGLPFDVYGQVSDDTVYVVFPAGTNLNALIPSFTFASGYCTDTVGTVHDFTAPLVLEVIGAGGCPSQWVVMADVETGQKQNIENSISVFPNPATEQMTISHAIGWHFEMFSTIGKPVLTGQISEPSQTININEFDPGIYFLKLQMEDDVFVKRLVICR